MAPSGTTFMTSNNKRKFEFINGNVDDFPSHPTKQRTTIRENTCLPMRPTLDQPESQISKPVVPTSQTPILKKQLTASDLGLSGARLLLPNTLVKTSLLLEFLTPEELELVKDKSRGLPVRASDWCGKEYNLLLKYLECNNACRLINEWSKFLRQNGSVMKIDDEIEIQVFRISKGEGRMELGMTMKLFPVSKSAGEEATKIEKEVCDKREDKWQEERNEESTDTDDVMEVTDKDLRLAANLLLLFRMGTYIDTQVER